MTDKVIYRLTVKYRMGIPEDGHLPTPEEARQGEERITLHFTSVRAYEKTCTYVRASLGLEIVDHDQILLNTDFASAVDTIRSWLPERQVTRTNLMTKLPFQEGEETPYYLSPSSETYWSR